LHNFYIGHAFERSAREREVFFARVKSEEQLVCIVELIKWKSNYHCFVFCFRWNCSSSPQAHSFRL